MQTTTTYKIKNQIDENFKFKGLFITILHAYRIPPHIGLIIDGNYYSLTIKGRELNVSTDTYLRNIKQKNIPTLFFQLKKHPIFSTDYLKEHFILNISKFDKVAVNKATCLSPIKLFFEETYAIDISDINFIYELIPHLESLELIENIYSKNIEEKEFELPSYSLDEINEEIKQANKEANEIKNNLKK